MPRLQVLNGKRQGATFDVGRGDTVVGHRNTANVPIDDPWVSWDHARIFFQGDAFWVEDLGSTNGTYVNCVRVKREQIKNEDVIFFGKTHVMFLASEDANDAPAPSAGSDFGLNVEALAAAAEQWSPPTRPRREGGKEGQRIPANQSPNGSVGPAIPVPADELSDPLGLAGFPLPPLPDPSESGQGFGQDASAARDPFRPGADPRWSSAPAGRASPALDPDADPFGSARTPADPFSTGDDPFAAPRNRRSTADTHIDEGSAEALLPRKRAGKPGDLGDFEIDERDPFEGSGPMPPASAHEVKRLLDHEASSDGVLDDLKTLLGDAAARTPQPFKPPASSKEPAPSAAPGSGSWVLPARSNPATPTRPGIVAHDDMPVPDLVPAVPLEPQRDAGELAFELAKLQDEARRAKLALEAVKQSDPEKVRAAALVLRDQELARQAREIAELRRELALLHEDMGKKQAELDLVTEDMIVREDQIDELSARLEALDPTFKRKSFSDAPPSPSPPSTAFAGDVTDDLTSLEF